MLGQVIAVKPKPIIGLDELQPLLDLLLERHAGIVHVFENAELHVSSSPNIGVASTVQVDGRGRPAMTERPSIG